MFGGVQPIGNGELLKSILLNRGKQLGGLLHVWKVSARQHDEAEAVSCGAAAIRFRCPKWVRRAPSRMGAFLFKFDRIEKRVLCRREPPCARGRRVHSTLSAECEPGAIPAYLSLAPSPFVQVCERP